MPERIFKAAVPGPDGKIWMGASHSDIRRALHRRYDNWFDRDAFPSGFVTSRKRFVDRREAYKIAFAADQLVPGAHKGQLLSEGVIAWPKNF
jgi:hypothetical protein